MRQRLLRLACALAALFAAPAHAQSAVGGNFAATASVQSGCGVSATAVNFGILPPGAATPQVDATGTITVTCTAGETWTLGLDQGVNAQGANRRMRHGTLAQFLGYSLYRNAARTQQWRDVPGQRQSGTGTGSGEPLTVYARLPAGQTPPAGPYLDTVTAIVRY